MKKSVSLILSLLMVISIIASVPVTVSATNERYLKFKLNSDGESYYVSSCKQLAKGEIVIPSTYQNKPVTSIGESAFDCCGELTSVTIPDSVTSIGYSAFENCESIKSISIPNSVTSIGYRSFSDCTSLTSVTIPDGVTSIGPWAFEGCKKLNSITISDSVTSIGTLAFYDTAYYNNEANWEDGVLYIGNHLIAANKVTGREGTFKGNISGDYVIKSGTKTIGYCAFENCTKLESVVIPDSVTSIANFAFQNCTSLESILLPDSVISIGKDAFYLCRSLNAVHITDIGAWCNINFAWEWDENEKQSTLYSNPLCYTNSLYLNGELVTNMVIPDGVKSINSGAFYDCTSLTSVIIPDSVKSIGDKAFAYCGDSLKYVFYSGSKSDWADITIGDYNAVITKRAIIHYNSTDHTSSEWITDKKATVYSAGKKVKKCIVCGEELKTAQIPQLKCSKPVIKNVCNENSYVRITWGTVKGTDSYEVYRKTGTGDYEYIGSTTNKYFNDKKAPAGKTCRYIVKAKNEAGCSKASESKAVKHIDEPTLKSIANTSAGVKIIWAKVTGAQKYSVYRKVSGGEYKYIGATSKTYYTDKTAKSGTKYYYAIRAKRDDSISSQSASLSKLYLDNPTLNTPTSTSKGIGLKWSKVTGAEGYKVYRRTASGSYKLISTEKGVSNVTFRDTTAKKGTKYYYKVKAYKGSTYSADSNTKAITDKY